MKDRELREEFESLKNKLRDYKIIENPLANGYPFSYQTYPNVKEQLLHQQIKQLKSDINKEISRAVWSVEDRAARIGKKLDALMDFLGVEYVTEPARTVVRKKVGEEG